MKINSLDQAARTAPATTDGKTAVDGRSGASAAAATSSATVALSSTASMLTGTDGSDFDAAKVQRIAQAIREGKFQVNAGAIADKLIDQTSQWLRSNRT